MHCPQSKSLLLELTIYVTTYCKRFITEWTATIPYDSQLNISNLYWFQMPTKYHIILLSFLFSCLGHKEYRFLFPILPLILFYCGRGFLHLGTALLPAGGVSKFVCSAQQLLISFIFIIQVFLIYYTCHMHQRGTNDLMWALGRRGDALNWASSPTVNTNLQQMSSIDRQVEQGYVRVLILMPCHSTPHLRWERIKWLNRPCVFKWLTSVGGLLFS